MQQNFVNHQIWQDDLLGRAKISFIVQQLQLVNDLVLHEPEAALPAPVM